MDITALVLIVISVAIMAAVILIAYFITRSRQAAWEELATQAGLAFEPGNYWGKSPRVSGAYHGHPMLLESVTRGYGRNRVTYTRIVFSLMNASELYLDLSTEGFGSKVKKLLGVTEIRMGDEAFDTKFFIQGGPERDVQRILSSSSLRQKLLDTKSVHIVIYGKEVSQEKRGFETNPEKLLAMFDLLGEMADVVNRFRADLPPNPLP